MLSNILFYLIMIIYIILGGGTTIVLTGYMFIVLVQKIVNKVKHGASLYS